MPSLTPRAAALLNYPRPEFVSPAAGSTVTPTEPLVWKSVQRSAASHFYLETSTSSSFTSPDTYRSDRGGFEYYSGSAWAAVPYTGVPAGVSVAYPYWRTITIDTTATGANISSTLTDFPICVAVNSSSWTTAGDRDKFFGTWNTKGTRVRFIDATGTSLAYEVESYDAAGQSAVYWVKVPTVTGNSTTVIALGYGADPIGTAQAAASSVWDSSYAAVYHLNPDLGQTVDSTSNGRTLTDNASATGTTGQIAKGAQFDGVDDYFETNYTLPATNVTLSAWGNSSSTQGYANRLIGNADSTAGANGLDIIWRSTAGTLYSVQRGGTTTGDISATATGISTGWHHVATTISSVSGGALYYDGVSIGTRAANTSITSSLTTRIGRDGNGTDKFNGYADEVRISTTARSADWIKAEYFSTKSTSWPGDGWLTFGTQQAVSGNVRLSTTLPTAAPLYVRVRQSK